MPKQRKNELIQCKHFAWRLGRRAGVWYADGRSNRTNAGRHSLGVKDRSEALHLIAELDQQRAEELSLAPRAERAHAPTRLLSLEEGRRLYETYVSRPRVTGGVREATAKRYRAVFDKFLPFAQGRGLENWNGVNRQTLTEYAADLESKKYAHKTLANELITIKQAVKWLIEEGHLNGCRPIELKLRKAESQRAYCWRPQEVSAMVAHCRASEDLRWLEGVIVALACTGLRISELAALRWGDIDLAQNKVVLTDETGRALKEGPRRELKSGRSRTFPIHPDLKAVFDRLDRSDPYVFHGPRGGRLKADTVRRILIASVITPLAKKFPAAGERGFADGRLHSFRHYFASTCANSGVPERMVMEWLGHSDSDMVRHYYHLHDEEARRQMTAVNFLGGAGGRSAGASSSINSNDQGGCRAQGS